MSVVDRGAPGGAHPRRAQWSWVLFEWANQPYFTLITIFIFAPYFARHIVGDPVQGQVVWGYVLALAGGIIAVSAPVFGAIADVAGRRKPWIAVFVAINAAACAGLWWAVPGVPVWVVGLTVVVAAISMEWLVAFCNAMLPDIAPRRRIGRLSAVAIALGQMGGLAALAIIALGFGGGDVSESSARFAGLLCAVWLVVFIVPLMIWTPDRPAAQPPGAALRRGLRRLYDTGRSLNRLRNPALYLLARMIYYDGMNAVLVFGGILAAASFGWGSIRLAVFGIVVTVFAGIGAAVAARLDADLGARGTLLAALTLCVVMTAVMIGIEPDRLFFIFALTPPDAGMFSGPAEQLFIAAACLFAAGVGPVIAASRTMMARIAPADMMTEFFGLYALAGKATAFLVPLLVALVTGAFGSQRLGLAVAIPFMLAGMGLLFMVRETPAKTWANSPLINDENAASR